jgi:hypothetical protein
MSATVRGAAHVSAKRTPSLCFDVVGHVECVFPGGDGVFSDIVGYFLLFEDGITIISSDLDDQLLSPG